MPAGLFWWLRRGLRRSGVFSQPRKNATVRRLPHASFQAARRGRQYFQPDDAAGPANGGAEPGPGLPGLRPAAGPARGAGPPRAGSWQPPVRAHAGLAAPAPGHCGAGGPLAAGCTGARCGPGSDHYGRGHRGALRGAGGRGAARRRGHYSGAGLRPLRAGRAAARRRAALRAAPYPPLSARLGGGAGGGERAHPAHPRQLAPQPQRGRVRGGRLAGPGRPYGRHRHPGPVG